MRYRIEVKFNDGKRDAPPYEGDEDEAFDANDLALFGGPDEQLPVGGTLTITRID